MRIQETPDLDVEAVPGIIGVIIGCPEGCGGVLTVPVESVQTEPAKMGALTATVRLGAAASVEAMREHAADCDPQRGPTMLDMLDEPLTD